MISVSVKDFGPIIEGSVELKPLTVFIGPNNSGKSHLATLVYALFHGGIFPSAYVDKPRNEIVSMMSRILFNDTKLDLIQRDRKLATEFSTWFGKSLGEGVDLSKIRIADLPEKLVRTMETTSEKAFAQMFSRPLNMEMHRCFGAETFELFRANGKESKIFRISLTHDKPYWQLDALPSDNEIKSIVSAVSFAKESVSIGKEIFSVFLSVHEEYKTQPTLLNEYMSRFVDGISHEVFFSLFKQFPKYIYYVPAARTGLLQGYKLLASEVVRNATGGGLSGVVRDFIGGMLTLEPGTRGELYEVAEFLEKKIARGQVYLEAAGVPYPEIRYEAQGQKYPMHRASSMVSELAPLILYLKHRLAPGDLLIFEEPESHLHPANQRILAHAIVKMVRKGVKVMLTTHSDYFLPQLGNFVRLSALEDERAKMGYDPDDYLNPEDVGCYLFKPDYEKGGSVVRELEVSAADGIVEDEFYSVGEALYNEYVDLEREAIKSSFK